MVIETTRVDEFTKEEYIGGREQHQHLKVNKGPLREALK